MTRTVTVLTALLAAAALFAAAFAARPAGAIVPPKDCDTVKVAGKRYNIKSDQLRCRLAREYSVRYLRYRTKPSGYKCYSYTNTKIKFRCVAARYNPDRTYYAIKR